MSNEEITSEERKAKKAMLAALRAERVAMVNRANLRGGYWRR